MKFSRILKKVISSALILSFSYTQLLWAGPRDLMAQAKSIFLEEDQRRGMSEDESSALASRNQAAVDHQNLLRTLEGPVTQSVTDAPANTNTFSLTTDNGDILKYVGNQLSQIQRPNGGPLLTDVSVVGGNIQDAKLNFLDGSIQKFAGGKINEYTTPDGTKVEYDLETGNILQTTTNDIITTYTYNPEGEVTLESPTHTNVYDQDQKLKTSLTKADGVVTCFENGMFQKIVYPDGKVILFQQTPLDTNIKVTLDHLSDPHEEELKEQLADLSADIQTIEAELAQKQAELIQKQSQSQDLENERSNTQTNLEDAQSDLENFDQETQDSVDIQESHIADLESQIQSLNTSYQGLLTELSNLDNLIQVQIPSQINAIQAQISQVTQDLTQAQTELEATQASLNDIHEEKLLLEGQIADLEDQITNLSNQTTSLEAERATAQGNLSQHNEELSTLESQRAILEEELSSLNFEFLTLQTAQAQLLAEIAQQNSAFLAAQEALLASQTQVDTLNAELTALETQKDSKLIQKNILSNEITGLESQIYDLNLALAQSEADLSQAGQRLEGIQSQILLNQNELASLETTKTQTQQRLQNINAQIVQASILPALKAKAFNGAAADYLDLGDREELESKGDFTITAWIKTSKPKVTIFNKKNNTSKGYNLWLNSSGYLEASFYGATGSITVKGNKKLSNNAWHHVAVTRQGNVFTLYVDGAQAAQSRSSRAIGDTSNTVSARIGKSSQTTSSGYPFLGSIGDVRIYNQKALTLNEVKFVKQANSPPIQSTTNIYSVNPNVNFANLQNLETQRNALNQALSQIQNQIAAKTQALNNLNLQEESLENITTNLQAQRTQLNASLLEAQNFLSQKESLRINLENEVVSLQTQILNKQAEIHAAAQELETLTNQVNVVIPARIHELEGDLSENLTQQTTTQTQIAQKQADLAANTTTQETLQALITADEALITELSSQITVLESQMSQTRTSLNAKNQELVTLQTTQSELEAGLSSLQSQITSLTNTQSDLSADLNAKQNELNSAIQTRLAKLAQSQSIASQITAKETELVEAQESLSNYIATTDQTAQSLQANIDSLTNQIDSLNVQIEALTTQITSLQTAIASQQTSLNDKLTQKEALQNELAAYQESLVQDSAALLANISFEYLIYRPDGSLKEVLTKDGVKLTFDETGLLKEALDAEGLVTTSFSFTPPNDLQNILGTSITQTALTSSFDETGRLTMADTGTFTIHYKKDSNEIDYIEKTDGTKIYALPERTLFSAEGGSASGGDAVGNISNALFITPEGEKRTYIEGKLTHLVKPDETEISYIFNVAKNKIRLSQLITPNDLTYTFSYDIPEMPDVIEANLVAPVVPNALDITKMTYDLDLNLKSALRQNKEILSYLDQSRLDTIGQITQEGNTLIKQKFNYNGSNLTSVTEGPSETFYDANGQPTRTLISSTTENPHALEINYQYGKVRAIKKDNNDVPTFEYSYSFDSEGQEITTIEDREENATKIYKEGLLESSEDKTNNVLSEYLYDENDQVSRVEVTRFGRNIHTYHYTYEDGKTFVEDHDEGVTRTYGDTSLKTITLKEEAVTDNKGKFLAYTLKEFPNPAVGNLKQKLLTLEKDKTLYAYTYTKNRTIDRNQSEALSEEMVKEEMVQKTLDDGSVSFFEKGKLVKVKLPDNTYLTDIVLNSKNNLISAAKRYTDGSKKIFGPTGLLEEVTTDNTHLYYTNNRVTKVIDSSGNESVYSYKIDAATREVTSIYLERPDGRLEYDLSGNLLGISLTDVADPLANPKYFIDQSTQPRVVSVTGDARLDREAKTGEGALLLDGSGDYLAIGGSDFDLGTGDFTIESWVNLKSDKFHAIASKGTNPQGWIFFVQPNSIGFYSDYNNNKVSNTTVSLSEWHHVAASRRQNTLKFFLDGVLVGSHDVTGLSYNGAESPLFIGAYNGGASGNLDGRTDSLRISKNIARYDVNFTTPAQAYTADEHTKLLLEFDGLNRGDFALETQTDALGQVTGYVLNGDLGKFLFNKDGLYTGQFRKNTQGDPNTFADASENSVLITAIRGAKLSNDALFGNAAAEFNGNGDTGGDDDSLVIADSESLDFGRGDFTLETRLKFDSFGQNHMIFSRNRAEGEGTYELNYAHGQGRLLLNFSGSVFKTESWSPQTNQWYHLAVVRKGGLVHLYVNGAELGTGTQDSHDLTSPHPLHLGGDLAGNRGLDGKMDEVRISDVARYHGLFTPAVEEFVPDERTSVLLHMNDENKIAFEKAKTLAQNLSGKLSSLAKFNHLSKMNFEAPLEDGLVATYRFGELKKIRDTVNDTLFTFKNSELSTITDSDGRVLTYTFDKDPAGRIQNVRLDNGLVTLKYDSAGKLQGFKRDGYFDLDEVQSQTEVVYEGGFVTGYLSTDGDFETMHHEHQGHGSGGAGTVVSEHRFPGPQTVTSVTFKMSAYARSQSGSGNYSNDYEALYYVEALRNGAWEQVPGSFGGTNKVTGKTSGYTVNSGIVTLNGLNLQNVEAIRAYAHGYGNSSDNANADGSASIYEFQWTLADTANYSFSKVGDTFKFQGHEGTLLFDAEGDPLGQVPSALQGVSDSLSGVVTTYEDLPNKNLMLLGVEHIFSPDLMALLNPIQAALPDSETVIIQEYSSSGILETQTKGDATVTLFDEENRPSQMLDADGKLLIQYFYDSEGHPSRVYLKNARDTLPGEISKSNRAVEEQRAAALKNLAIQEHEAITQIENAANAQKEAFLSNLSLLGGQRTIVQGTEVKGKQAKAQKSDILNQIAAAEENMQLLLTQTNHLEADSYAKLNDQVEEVSERIKRDSKKAFDEIAKQEASAKKDILRQEVSPIVYDNYRRILGRDPSTTEYDEWIDKIDYDSGNTLTGKEETVLKEGTSIKFNGNGNPSGDDDHLTVNASEDFDFGTGDYTIETWTRLDSIGENIAFFGRNHGDGQGGYQLNYSNPNKQLVWQQNGPVIKGESWNPEIERWYHLAVVRKDGQVSFYIDGKELGSATEGSGDITGSTNLDIGADLAGNWGLDGRLEGFMISKGKARYDGNFDPLTVQFIPDTYTKLLLGTNKEKDSLRDLSSAHRFIYSKGDVSIDDIEYKTQIPTQVPVIQYNPNITNIITGYDTQTQLNPGASIAFDGQGDVLTLSDSSDWDLGDRDFGVELWTKFDDTVKSQGLVGQWGSSGRAWLLFYSAGRLYFYWSVDGSNSKWVDVPWTAPSGDWSHLAVTRESGALKFLVNGSQVGSNFTVTDSFYKSSNTLKVGDTGQSDFFKGHIDRLKVTSGPDSHAKLLLKATDTKDSLRDLSDSHHFVRASGNVLLDTTDYKVPETIVTRTPQTASFIPALQTHLRALPELGERRTFVKNVQQSVEKDLEDYFTNDTMRNAVLAKVGLTLKEVVKYKTKDDQKRDFDTILGWLKGQRDADDNPINLHFGQSAFLALESLLDQKGISYAREDIAAKAILVDILAGVITPMDEGDLILSVFALNKVASLYGLTLSGAKLTWEDLQALYGSPSSTNASEDEQRPRVVAHINGNHYVIITSITDDTITYIDPGIGKDKENESLTIRKEGFLKAWRGNVTAETTILNPVIPSPQNAGERSRFLSLQETMSIRGAFWGSILNLVGWVLSFTPLAPFVWIIRIAALAVSVVEGDWISAISAGISLGLGDVGQGILNGLKSAFHGVAQALGPLGQILNGIGQVIGGVVNAVSSVYQGVTGFFNGISQSLGAFANGLPEIAGELVKSAVAIGVNFAVSKGLETIGVNPQISGFVGTLVSGGIIGGMSPISAAQAAAGVTQATLIQSSILQAITLEGVGRLGVELGLDAGFTSIIGLSLGAMQGNIITNPGTALEAAFNNIKPQLFSSLALWGIDKLGTSLGLDSRIATAIASPISAAIGIGLQAGQTFGENIIRGIQDGIVAGVTGYGITFAADQIAPGSALAAALLSRTFTGLIDGVLNPNISMFQGAFNALSESVGNLAKSMTSSDFSQLIQQKGLAAALQENATAVFSRDAIEQIVQAGGIAQILNGNARFTEISFGGGALIPVKEVNFGTTTLYYSALNDQNLYGRKIGNRFERGYFGYDAQGGFGLRSGEVEIDLGGGVKVQVAVNNYQAQGYELRIDGQPVLLSYAQNNQYELGPDLAIENGVLESRVTGAKIVFKDGQAQEIFIPGPDNNPLQLSGPLPELSSQGLSNLMTYIAISNGINNTMPAGQLPFAMEGLAWAIEQSGGDSSKVIMPLPTFEGSPGGNEGIVSGAATWFRDVVFGTNEVTNDILDTMYQAFAANPDLQTSGGTMVLYSGSGNPGLKANDTANFNIKSVVMIGSPTLKFDIKNPNTNTILNIFGSNDAYLGSFGGQFYSDHTLNQFNVMINGVGHTDYFTTTKVRNEIAQLVSIANDSVQLFDRLNRPSNNWYTKDTVTGIYTLDPDKLPDNNQ